MKGAGIFFAIATDWRLVWEGLQKFDSVTSPQYNHINLEKTFFLVFQTFFSLAVF